MHWYVLQVYSGNEKRVKRLLEERVANAGMREVIGRILVPSEEIVELRGGQKRKSERRFYPGYVLIEMEMNESAWHLVRSTPQVFTFVGGTAEKPAPLAPQEIESILHRMEDIREHPRPKVLFEAGEVIRIIDGPFSDFDGMVEGVNYEKNRLKVSVTIFGRSTPVELDFHQVEKTQ